MQLLINAWLERKNPMIEICNSSGQLLFTLDSYQVKELFESGDICLEDLKSNGLCNVSFSDLLNLYFSSLRLNFQY